MSIGCYNGQRRKERELVVKELGTERAALMSDDDVAEWIEGNFAIFWGDRASGLGTHDADEETIVLIPNEVYEGVKDSLVWLRR